MTVLLTAALPALSGFLVGLVSIKHKRQTANHKAELARIQALWNRSDSQQERIDELTVEVRACHLERDELLIEVEAIKRELWLIRIAKEK